MERVQFQQEQMLAELKDLIQKGLFSQKEVKQIMQKRTAFETALVRRIPKKTDFLRYATYEMSLEALRRKRAERLKIPKGPSSVSDYALVRRQFQIFERALKKFKGDVGLWIQYIQLAKKEGARALVGRITARALQLHPNVPALYVLAASHELEHLSPTAARALLQRGLRLNSDSVEMWREYVRMEMGFVESLRRRWSILGIDVKGKGKDMDAGKTKGDEKQTEADDPWAGLGEDQAEEDAARMDVDAEDEEVGDDEAARREIMNGAIIRSAISKAVEALPKIELFASLHELISTYPSPRPFRESLLDHLHSLLRRTLPSLPAAIKLSATRHLTPDAAGESLVDELKRANETLYETVRSTEGEATTGVACVYAEFVEEWCGKDVDDSLKAYLITSLHLLIQQLPAPVPPALLAAHIQLLASHHTTLGSGLLPAKANTPQKILRVARKHTAKSPTRASVWLARLGAERAFADQDEIESAWAEARKSVSGDGVQDVWLWGLEPSNRSRTRHDEPEDEVKLLEHLLHESQHVIREPTATVALHEPLLIRYAAASHRALLYHTGYGNTGNGGPGRMSAHTDSTAEEAPGYGASPGERDNANAQRKIQQAQSDASSPAPAKPQHQQHQPDVDARLARVRQIGTAYVPSTAVWAEVFRQEAQAEGAAGGRRANHSYPYPGDADGDARVLRAVYEFWRQTDGVEATVAWTTWLLRSGRAKEAVAVVARARSVLGEEGGDEVERRWKAVLDGDAAAGEGRTDDSTESAVSV